MRLAVATGAVLALLAAAGCGGGGDGGTGAGSREPLTREDLIGVVGPAPDVPEGAAYNPDAGASTYTLADLRARAQTASDRTTVRALERSGFEQIYQRSFDGPVNVADATAYLFRDADGAAKAFAYLKGTLDHTEAGSGTTLSELSADGLGEESWGAHLSGESESALFLFRTRNLVVVADMSCDGACEFDVGKAARAYADGIDERAKAS
ncbi:MAG TPA: hypothetical protein VFB26_01170 [Gaiellaceae bacterium]|nr:hypothetical protein [Gaiellaceae bacterium]